MKKLYIPVNIRKRKEIAEGIGMAEVLQIGIAVAVGFMVGIFLAIIKGEMLLVIFPPVLFGGIGLLLFRKDRMNQSLMDKLVFMMEFNRNQKRFYYKYFDRYKEGIGNEKERNSRRKGIDSK